MTRLLIMLPTLQARILCSLGFDARNVEPMPNSPMFSVFDVPITQLAPLCLLYREEVDIIARLPLVLQEWSAQELAA